jgi:phosphoribosylformimino-5-aminoimidazole carboxamide ribotide isomerase
VQVLPAVDVLGGRVVRLRQGKYDHVTTYGHDPTQTCLRWIDRGAELVHVVDLEGARSGAPDRGLWKRLGEAGIPFQVGGGIRSVDAARSAIELGASRVVVGSVAIHQPAECSAVIDAVGSSRVVVALDVKEGRALGSGWLDAGKSLAGVVRTISRIGAVRVLVTGIARDGEMTGPDLPLLRRVMEADPGLLVLASGGVRGVDDISALGALGVEGAIVGRALYEPGVTFREVIEAADSSGVTGPPR